MSSRPVVNDTRVVFDTTIITRDQDNDGLRRGEEIATAIGKLLERDGFRVSEPDATSWSWMLEVEGVGAQITIHIAANVEWAPPSWPSWAVVIDSPSLWAKLLGRQPAFLQALARLQEALQAALSGDARFSRIGWLADDEWCPGSTATPRAMPRR